MKVILTPKHKNGFRADIQALRTVAVLLVVLFHLWPNRISGGFVGVDVFFVVSGYLITNHILRDVETGRFSVFGFWARRARRLIPASFTVLVLTALGIVLWVPLALWGNWLAEVNSSIFYVENWVLAYNSVDYLALDNSASPTQHFWSLGVEEQFYIVWPILIAIALLLVPKTKKSIRRKLMFLILLLVTLSSFGFGVWTTNFDPAVAYFSTPVRAWEFGVGAITAFIPALVHRFWSPTISIFGFAAISSAGLIYDPAIPFPGTAALLPVLATALVIFANVQTGIFSKMIAWRPIQWIGDRSYSIYLWHWPLIILTPYALAEEKLTTIEKIFIVMLALALSAASARFIERPLMSSGIKPNLRPRTVFAALLILSTLIGGLCITAIDSANKQNSNSLENTNKLAQELTRCLGAQAIAVGEESCVNDSLTGFYPDLNASAQDAAYMVSDCGAESRTAWLPEDCQIGIAGSAIRIALVGDSHAGQYRAGLARLAKLNNWSVNSFLKSGCPYTDAVRVHDQELTDSCRKWLKEVKREIWSGNFDVVITSQASGVDWVTNSNQTQEAAAESGLESAWSELARAGIQVLVIKDHPRPAPKWMRCLELNSVADCSQNRSAAFLYDPQIQAVDRLQNPNVKLVDLDKYFCSAELCEPVIGHVIVYKGISHLTGTYVTTLSPYIEPEILSALARASGQ